MKLIEIIHDFVFGYNLAKAHKPKRIKIVSWKITFEDGTEITDNDLGGELRIGSFKGWKMI